jgi:3',5'-cyclic AMP phosphodiesterase CpdA
MLIAQVSDSHVEAPGTIVHGAYDPHAAFVRALDKVAAVEPRVDFLLHTGDVTHHGDASIHRNVRAELERTRIPYVVMAGNHDENETLRNAFADKPWMPTSGFLHYVIDVSPVRIICLDTTLPGKIEGAMCAERMDWLAARLAEMPSAPTMIAMHHPAFRIGRATSDARPFGNAQAFAALIARYPSVSLITAGHVHCTLQARIGNAVALAVPSTVYDFAMDRRPGAPLSVINEPPGYYLHDWTEANGFTSQCVLIGDYETRPTRPAAP